MAWRRFLSLALLLSLACLPLARLAEAAAPAGAPAASPAATARAILPLAEVRAGLQGTGYTVIRGIKVEPFDVEVLGVVPNAGPTGDLILVRVGGPLIDETGGIAAGMSGSPVYVDGRLIGAVSYGFSFSDHRVGFLTPIGHMLPVLDLALARGGAGEGRPAGEGPSAPLPEVVSAATPVPPATSLATPLFVSGMDERVFRRLQKLVASLGFRVELGGQGLPGGSPGAGGPAPAAGPVEVPREQFVPGSAFGAALVTGDVSVTAIGTVTYVEGDYFLGFGHPFLNKGKVGLPVSLAEIYQTVKSAEAPFKLGAPRQLVGTLLEDRPAAVAGKLAALPEGIEVRVTVEDQDRQEKSVLIATVTPDETLTTDLVALAVLQGMDRGLLRIGRGTAEVRLTVKGDGLPDGAVTRENLFYSGTDVAAVALRDLLRGMLLITENPFRPVNLRQVELSARVGEERRTGVIEKLRLVKDHPVRPGESAELEALVRPFRGEMRRERILLPIPADFPTGRHVISAHGGGTSAAPEEEEPEAEAPPEGEHPPNPEKIKKGPAKAEEPKNGAESLEALLDQFVRRDRNDELIAELVSDGNEGEEGAGDGAPAPAKIPAGHPAVRRPGKPPTPPASTPGERPTPKARLTLPYVVLGSAQVEIEVGPGGSDDLPLRTPPAPRWEKPRRED